tara:strand:- start:4317 stop:4490 length:174 start_codon:yes stop_codon:yes gene_type:complete
MEREKKIRIPYDDKKSFKDRIVKQAEKEERSMNNLIHIALKTYLDSKDKLFTPKIYK